ncbi:WD_0853 family protein [Wolbachia endosymbiont of Dirofilaria (Dirofilaria) immitis]|uniref:WD_0853 family protein n=1 Tax=Wolbachia endosymbiont of Dirofilaria (Dirofilaria) immitis TaxID=1812115 RepID=UPI00158B8C71|nr:hypothetical protein [Wolbachia endosymbiont of Dirofilaria (Dirofilaria) immitis]QKX02069.1 hypothetical protein GOY12_00470 [Wolbachia endosymbiont of Dirofilaria (Dirofilaria) immitis]
MKISKKNFKGFNYYKLHQDKNGNIKLNDYNDILNARKARVDLLLDNNIKQNDINLSKINKALSKKLINNRELLSEFDSEDQKVAQEELKVFNILDNLNDLTNIKSKDLLEVSLLLSDLSFIERNVVLNPNYNPNLAELKKLFIEKKASGKEYSDEECKSFLDNVDKINTLIKLELESRIKGLTHDETNDYNSLQDETSYTVIDIPNKPKKSN